MHHFIMALLGNKSTFENFTTQENQSLGAKFPMPSKLIMVFVPHYFYLSLNKIQSIAGLIPTLNSASNCLYMYLLYLDRVQLVSVADLGGAGTHPPLFWVKKKEGRKKSQQGKQKKPNQTKTKQNKNALPP